MNERPRKRRWCQFSLRTLLIAVFLLSLPLSWYSAKLQRARRYRAAIEAIEDMGGRTISHSFFAAMEEMTDASSWSRWQWKLRSWRWALQRSYLFDTIASVHFEDTPVTDTDLKHLETLKELEVLTLSGTAVTDRGLEHLKGLTGLYWLDLSNTQVTTEGVKKLQEALPECEIGC